MTYLVQITGLLTILFILKGRLMLIFRQNYTREKYIRIEILSLITLLIFFILFAINPIVFFKAIPYETLRLIIPERALICILLLTLISTFTIVNIRSNLNNWQGKKSTLQFLEEIGERKRNFKDVLQAIIKNDSVLKEWSGQSLEIITPLIRAPKEQTKEWSIHAAEILMFLDHHYNLNISQDEFGNLFSLEWYAEENCFLSYFGNSTILTGIFCPATDPTIVQLERFYNFVKRNSKDQNKYDLVVLVESEQLKKTEISWDDGSIKIRYQWEMINSLGEKYFKKYKENIIKSFEQTPINTINTTALKEIYVEPSGITNAYTSSLTNEVKIPHLEQYLLRWQAENSNENKKQIALLGDYGQGKSVMALKLAYSIFQSSPSPERIPIVYELRGLNPKSYKTKLDFFAVWSAQQGINPKLLMKLYELGKLLIIFDGFDEMNITSNFKERSLQFQKLWSFSTSNSKILITGRPNYFLTDKEFKSLLKTDNNNPQLPYCEVLQLEMFNLDQIKSAIRNKSPKIQNQILNLLKSNSENSAFRDLMQRPSLLFIASSLWEENNMDLAGNVFNSALVIENFLQYSYNQQILKLQRPILTAQKPENQILEVSERAYFMMGIAVYMWNQSASVNQIKLIDLNDLMYNLINSFDEQITNIEQNRNSDLTFAQRIPSKKANGKLLRDVISCGILVKDYSAENTFRFSHKAYFEYLISRYYVSQLLIGQTKNIYSLYAKNITDTLKVDLLTFLPTLETGKFIGELLTNDLNINTTDTQQLVVKLFKVLYPVKILDRYPTLAFPSLKSFSSGFLLGMFLITCALMLSYHIHPFYFVLGVSPIVFLLLLFGLRIWFRIGMLLGSVILGKFITNSLIPSPENAIYPYIQDNLFLVNVIEVLNNDKILILFPVFVFTIFTTFITKFFLVKSSTISYLNLIAWEHRKIDNILKLWVTICQGMKIPDGYLLKYMSKRKLKWLKNENN